MGGFVFPANEVAIYHHGHRRLHNATIGTYRTPSLGVVGHPWRPQSAFSWRCALRSGAKAGRNDIGLSRRRRRTHSQRSGLGSGLESPTNLFRSGTDWNAKVRLLYKQGPDQSKSLTALFVFVGSTGWLAWAGARRQGVLVIDRPQSALTRSALVQFKYVGCTHTHTHKLLAPSARGQPLILGVTALSVSRCLRGPVQERGQLTDTVNLSPIS